MLIKDSQPFLSSISKRNTVDLDIVGSELEKVAFTRPQVDQLCKELAEPLGVKVDVLRRVGAEVDPSHKIIFEALEPWPDPVTGNDLVLKLVDIQQKHIILSEEAILTVVLWGLLTSVSNSDAIDTLPFLTISSPEKRCGKSRLQTVLGWMSLRPLRASNISSAAVYRTVEACCPTLLLDEADTFVDGNEELRGILNSGHTRDQAPILQVAELIGPPWKDAAYAAMRALNPGGNGDPESESRNEDSTTALLIPTPSPAPARLSLN